MGIISYLKANYEIAPLIVFVSFACVGAATMLGRAALKNPDVSWDKKKNPHPWLNVKPNEQLKLYSVKKYDDLKDEKPKGVHDAES